jgi:hypothetical protein
MQREMDRNAAMCIGLVFAAPWLALAYGIASAWRWLVG